MHAIGVVLSIGALLIGGLDNPAIGFPIVVAILISLEVLPPPEIADREILRIIDGSIRGAGYEEESLSKKCLLRQWCTWPSAVSCLE